MIEKTFQYFSKKCLSWLQKLNIISTKAYDTIKESLDYQIKVKKMIDIVADGCSRWL